MVQCILNSSEATPSIRLQCGLVHLPVEDDPPFLTRHARSIGNYMLWIPIGVNCMLPEALSSIRHLTYQVASVGPCILLSIVVLATLAWFESYKLPIFTLFVHFTVQMSTG